MKEKINDILMSSKTYKRFHGAATIFWGPIMIPIAFLTGLKSAIWFITFISLYANFATHFGAWQASRAEVKVDEESGLIDVRTADTDVSINTACKHCGK